jgi:hypothetical protein
MVYKLIPEWNCLHQKTQYFLKPTDASISEGKAKRLLAYAVERMEFAGFPTSSKVEISTTEDGGYYHVQFVNEKGGSISVQGILLGAGGWPSLDHGFHIEAPVWKA